MKKIMIAALIIFSAAAWCFYQLGKQENRYIRCGRGHEATEETKVTSSQEFMITTSIL